MGISPALLSGILGQVFVKGNVIKLLNASGTAIGESYTIQDGDFSVNSGVATSAKNMMIYLCEKTGGDGTATKFGVYKGTTLYYDGEFTTPMTIGYNTVPTIKKYNASKGEGIQVTMTSTDVSG